MPAFSRKLPAEYLTSDFLFLANIDPVLQTQVRDSMPNAKLVGGDTMNYWINDHRANLGEMLKRVDVLLINDTEAKILAGDSSLPRAARKVLELGPKALVIKHGEYGATIFFRDGEFAGGTPSVSRSRLYLWRKCATQPARATALPEASWATSLRKARSPATC